MIKNILEENNLIFSESNINASQLRVLKYLKYKINLITPYNFIQIFLEILSKNENLSETKILYVISVKILELFYFEREDIYNSLFKSFTERDKTEKDK
jgi:hypothetical protein